VEAPDRVTQRPALDEAHGVTRPAFGVLPQAMHRHNAGVLQLRRDLGFKKESPLALGIVPMVLLDALQGHLAVQLLVLGQVDFTQATAGVEPQWAVTVGLAERPSFRLAGGQGAFADRTLGLANRPCRFFRFL
jgi:hypothetical protein